MRLLKKITFSINVFTDTVKKIGIDLEIRRLKIVCGDFLGAIFIGMKMKGFVIILTTFHNEQCQRRKIC